MSTEYTRFRSGIDAMVEYLRQHGPTVRQDAIKAVVAGGWAAGDENAYWKLIDAVRHQLEDSRRPRIVALGENRIGLPERTED
jgi:HEAT repeat protein